MIRNICAQRHKSFFLFLAKNYVFILIISIFKNHEFFRYYQLNDEKFKLRKTWGFVEKSFIVAFK